MKPRRPRRDVCGHARYVEIEATDGTCGVFVWKRCQCGHMWRECRTQ